jgi:hypothetical protein
VDGRDKPGHDEAGACFDLEALSCPAEVPGIHEFHYIEVWEEVMAGTSPAMTKARGA